MGNCEYSLDQGLITFFSFSTWPDTKYEPLNEGSLLKLFNSVVVAEKQTETVWKQMGVVVF